MTLKICSQTFIPQFSLLLLVLSGIPQTSAQWVEYSHFSDYEAFDVNTSLKIDSEYFSDVLTFKLPMAMESEFRHQSKIFDISVGSLSSTRFATQQRFKFDHSLTEDLIFRFVYFSNEDFEKNHQVSLVELQYLLTQWLSVVAYGDFTSQKKHNDFGAAFLVKPTSETSVRVFATWSDAFFNKRTESRERDLGSSQTFGIVARWLPQEDTATYLEVYSTFQSPLNRWNEDEQKNYRFQENKQGLAGRLMFQDKEFINFDLSYKKRTEGTLFVDPSLLDGLWTSHQWDNLIQYENPKWVFGVANYCRDWQYNREGSQQRFLLPHLWLKGGQDSLQDDVWRIGLEMTWAYMRGSQALLPAPELLNEFEYRANFRYSIRFNERALLHLQLTGDLDDLSWEGGNGQFHIFF